MSQCPNVMGSLNCPQAHPPNHAGHHAADDACANANANDDARHTDGHAWPKLRKHQGLLVQFQTVRDNFFGGLKPKSCSWSLSLCCRWSQWMSSLLFMFKCVLRRLIEWHWVLFSVVLVDPTVWKPFWVKLGWVDSWVGRLPFSEGQSMQIYPRQWISTHFRTLISNVAMAQNHPIPSKQVMCPQQMICGYMIYIYIYIIYI